MRAYARLVTESKDARSVSQSLNADNLPVGTLSVKSTEKDGFVVSEISSDSLTGLLSTVDDILRCQMASESLL